MKDVYKSIYRIPLLGFAARWFTGLARLPHRFESYDAQLTDLSSRTRLLEAAGGRHSERLGEVERLLAGIHASLAEVHNLAQAGSRAGTDALAQSSQLRAAFDQHLPALLNLVSSSEHSLRLIRREQEELRARSRADLEAASAHASSASEGIRAKVEEVALAAQAAMLRAVAAETAGNTASTMLASVASDLGALRATEVASAGEIASIRQDLAALSAGLVATRADDADAMARLQGADAAVNDLRSTTGYLLGRVEFVRRELLYELRYGVGAAGSATEAQGRIVNEEKVRKAVRKGLKLNVGCGHLPAEGYVNVDMRELPGVDIVAEATELPFKGGEVAEIFSSHLLEHFPQEQLVRQILPHWRLLLRKGGVLRTVVPDAAAMIAHYGEGAYPYEDLREVLYGGQDYDGDFHFNMFTPESLRAILEGAGFSSYEVVEAGRRNGRCYEFEAVARSAP